MRNIVRAANALEKRIFGLSQLDEIIFRRRLFIFFFGGEANESGCTTSKKASNYSPLCAFEADKKLAGVGQRKRLNEPIAEFPAEIRGTWAAED